VIVVKDLIFDNFNLKGKTVGFWGFGVKPLSNILIQMKKRKYLEEVSAEK